MTRGCFVTEKNEEKQNNIDEKKPEIKPKQVSLIDMS